MINNELPLLVLEDTANQCFRTGRDSELFYDPKSGDVWKVSDMPRWSNPVMSMDEALALEEKNRLLRLPKARDLQEIDIMDEYTDYVSGPLQKDLLTILRQGNPFQAWRNRLEQAGMIEAYVQFRNERGAELLIDWCEENDIPYRHQIDLLSLSEEFRTKRFDDRDAPVVWKFFNGRQSLRNVKADLVRTPEGVTLDQKFCIGYFDEETMIAYLDLLLDFPADCQATIGTFEVHNQKTGTNLIRSLENVLAQAGFAHIETKIEEQDDSTFSLWEQLGYGPLRKENGFIILGKEQELPEEEYVPEFEETTEWVF